MKSSTRLYILIICCFGLSSFTSPNMQYNESDSQSVESDLEALNNYIGFINESTHGLLIAVKLLENFNLDINKYVDLASYKINQYSNDDLPKDIFEDTEHWFYDVTPYEWFDKAMASGNSLSQKQGLDKNARTLKAILKSINKVRFDLEDLIKTQDLTKRENLGKVYEKLEEAAASYQKFFEVQMQMESMIRLDSELIEKDGGGSQPFYAKMKTAYESSKGLLIRIRNKNNENLNQVVKINKTAIQKLINTPSFGSTKGNSSKFKFNWDNIKNAGNNLLDAFDDYNTTGSVTEQYKIYGKYYYFYNVNCISKFNRYGTGIVTGFNNAIDMLGLPKVKFTELPHYFKVIYPKKLEKVDFVESSINHIQKIPEVMKDRKVAKTNNNVRVTEEVIEVLFYDHMIADGDVVSVSFNGDWIMEKEELELAPKKFKIRLNPSGKNYLLLHADDIGQRPPCTIGVSYYMGNTKKEVILRSDLQTSELIEFKMVK